MTEQEFIADFVKVSGVYVTRLSECLNIFAVRDQYRRALLDDQRSIWHDASTRGYEAGLRNFTEQKDGKFLTYDQVRSMTIAELAEFAKDDV